MFYSSSADVLRLIGMCSLLKTTKVTRVSFLFNRCSEGIEDENTQKGQAAGLYSLSHTYTRTNTNKHGYKSLFFF